MRCLKCNRETEDNQVFCEACLAQMRQDPIKPGTPVNLPKRPPSKPRVPVRAQIRPEEQVAALEKQVHRLHKWIAVLTVAFLLAAGALAYGISTAENEFGIGQNYRPMPTVTAPAETN